MSAVAGVGASAADSVTTLTKNDAGSEDRFLKLLVAQMKNQDPLNPLDNAQVTSQMAQINTVSGIERLNTTVAGLNSQLVQLQTMQGAALVGHEVTVSGDRLSVAGSIDLGALSAGRHAFEWPAGTVQDGDGYRFRVTGTAGSASVVSGTLMRDHVDAVSSAGNVLSLELSHSGTVAYDKVKAFN
jgi:flagellar basal-body rod modification protein FlgD